MLVDTIMMVEITMVDSDNTPEMLANMFINQIQVVNTKEMVANMSINQIQAVNTMDKPTVDSNQSTVD